MELVRLSESMIAVGASVEFDIFDEGGRLLLGKGSLVRSEDQRDRLIDRGLFAEEEEVRRHFPDAFKSRSGEFGPLHGSGTRLSVLELLDHATRETGSILRAKDSDVNLQEAIRTVATSVIEACNTDSDAALARILLVKNASYAIRQTVNVAILSSVLRPELGGDLADHVSIVAAALTMNVSMLDLQDHLYSQRAPLEPDQKRTILDHPGSGAALLRARGVTDDDWIDAVEQHHESLDGSGYSRKLSGDSIGRGARILALCDRYAGMVSERSYRSALPPGNVLGELYTKHGNALEQSLTAMLVKRMGVYPPGTIVELANGERAVVTRRILDTRNPVVQALCGINGKPYDTPKKRMTATKDHQVVRVLGREALQFDLDLEMLWPRTFVEGQTEDRAFPAI